MSTEVKYASGYTAIRRDVPRYGMGGYAPGQGASGYGSKISTDYMVHFPGEPANRLYRVYCICWSNVGSHYIIRKGEKLYLKGHELEEALEKSGAR